MRLHLLSRVLPRYYSHRERRDLLPYSVEEKCILKQSRILLFLLTISVGCSFFRALAVEPCTAPDPESTSESGGAWKNKIQFSCEIIKIVLFFFSTFKMTQVCTRIFSSAAFIFFLILCYPLAREHISAVLLPLAR